MLGACREAQSTTQASSAVTAQDSVLVQASDTTLVGKRLYLSFDGNSSVVEYLSPQHLYWFSKDSVHGEKEGRDYYNSLHIEPHVFFVNWVERDGTTVSQVIDLKERTCQAFMTSAIYSPSVLPSPSRGGSHISRTVCISSLSSPLRSIL